MKYKNKSRRWFSSSPFCGFIFLLALVGFAAISVAQEKVTVLKVKTLIDGTGADPIKDAVIVIKGKRIHAVGKTGDVTIPQGAEVIEFSDQTAIPGLVDTHAHYRAWQGEIYLNHGVTTAFDIGSNPFRWRVAQKNGIDKGEIVGPRLLIAGRINAKGRRSRRGRARYAVKTPKEAAEGTRKLIASGVDIIKALEKLNTEMLRAIVEEAHKAGKPVVVHSINGTDALLAGVEIDAIEHSHSVALAVVGSEEEKNRLHKGRTRRKNRLTSQEVHNYMQEASYDRLIKKMVSKNVSWSPTLSTSFRAFSPQREKFKKEEFDTVAQPGLAYIPDYFKINTQQYFEGTANLDPELYKKIQTGYKKIKGFIHRFVKAGGKIRTGSDPNSILPALAIHREMELLVEAGLTPKQALMAATKNPAENVGREKDFGTLAPGRFADIVIVDGDPLRNISDTKKIQMVFKEGKAIKPVYHADYRNPIPRPAPDRRAARIRSVSPESVKQTGKPITITLKGRNFLTNAIVKLNNKPIPAKIKFRKTPFPKNFRRGREITATIPPELIREPGAYVIVVEHPGNSGSISGPAYLIVEPPQ